MIKLLIGSLLVATTTLGQTTPQTPKGSATKSTPASATSAGTKTGNPAAASANKPLPQTTRKQKLQSGNSNIPSYRMEKDAGVHKVRNRYPRKDAKKNQ